MANNSCEDIVLKKFVVSGLQGPKGDKGDPGDAVSFPIEAVNISVTNAGYNNLQEVLDALLYIPMELTSFSANQVLFENRSVLDPSANFNIVFTWSIIGTPTTQTFTGPSEMTSIAPDPVQPETRIVTATMTAFNSDATFTLATSDGNTSLQSTINVEFTNNIYYGYSSIPPGGEDATFIKSLTPSLQKTKDLFVSGAGLNNYFWYAVPVAYGVPIFKDFLTGLEIDMETPLPFTAANGNQFENDRGHFEDYYLYRSTNILNEVDINIT